MESMHFLSSCYNLTELRLHLPLLSLYSKFPVLSFPKLTSLEVSDNATMQFRRFIHTPSLTNLVIVHFGSFDYDLDVPVTTMLNPLNLRRVKISWYGREGGLLPMSFAAEHTGLRELTLEGCKDVMSVLLLLIGIIETEGDGSGNIFFPNLENLDLSVCYRDERITSAEIFSLVLDIRTTLHIVRGAHLFPSKPLDMDILQDQYGERLQFTRQDDAWRF